MLKLTKPTSVLESRCIDWQRTLGHFNTGVDYMHLTHEMHLLLKAELFSSETSCYYSSEGLRYENESWLRHIKADLSVAADGTVTVICHNEHGNSFTEFFEGVSLIAFSDALLNAIAGEQTCFENASGDGELDVRPSPGNTLAIITDGHKPGEGTRRVLVATLTYEDAEAIAQWCVNAT